MQCANTDIRFRGRLLDTSLSIGAIIGPDVKSEVDVKAADGKSEVEIIAVNTFLIHEYSLGECAGVHAQPHHSHGRDSQALGPSQ